jgi:hypothetical protein
MAAVAFGQRPLTTSPLAAAAARRRKESEQERVKYRILWNGNGLGAERIRGEGRKDGDERSDWSSFF